MIKKIPKTFTESSKLTNLDIENLMVGNTMIEDTVSGLYYEPSDGEMLEVVQWLRYPSYDFIIGIPTPDSPRAEKEKACLVVRYKTEKSYATYFDRQELGDIINGLTEIFYGRAKE